MKSICIKNCEFSVVCPYKIWHDPKYFGETCIFGEKTKNIKEVRILKLKKIKNYDKHLGKF